MRDLVESEVRAGWMSGYSDGFGRWRHGDRRWLTAEYNDRDNTYTARYRDDIGGFAVELRPGLPHGLDLVISKLTDRQLLNWCIDQTMAMAR